MLSPARTLRLVAAMVLIAGTQSACVEDLTGPSQTTPTNHGGTETPPPTEPTDPPHAVTHRHGDLLYTLTADAAEYEIGDEATFSLTIRNEANEPRTLTYSTGQEFDFRVGEGRSTAWNWAHDRSFTRAFHDRRLGPGETLRHEWTWSLEDNDGEEIEPGEYELHGISTTTSRRTLGPLEIEILED